MSETKNISTSCYVMPETNFATQNENLRIKGNSVQYNATNTNQKVNFNYNKVYVDNQDFSKSAFNTSISPLIKQTIEGHSAMVILAGVHHQLQHDLNLSHEHNVASNHSHSIAQNLISQSAGQLINSVFSTDGQNRKLGSVTFSWYTVDCHQNNDSTAETVTDILKMASTMGTGATNNSNETALMLRELGKGRGIVVPGLWEVEIASSADVESVIAHVQKMIPSANLSPNGGKANQRQYHTVMQLSVTNKSKAVPTASPVKNTTVADPPGLGRLTFLMLANITPPSAAAHFNQNGVSLSPWTESVHNIVTWLESKRASPPFHKSRLLLILKDVLCGRQAAQLMLFVENSSEKHEFNFEWFRLIARMSKDHNNDGTHAINSNNTGQHNNLSMSQAATMNLQNSLHSTTANNIKAIRSSTPTGILNRRNNNNNSNAALNATNNVTQYQGSEMSFLDNTMLGGVQHNNNNRAQTPSNIRRANSNSDIANVHLQSGVSSNTMQTPSTRTHHIARPPTQPPTQQQINNNNLTDNPSAEGKSEYVDDFAHREHEAALSLALEASRNEAAALKIAYNYANEKYTETKTAYDTLLAQLKEEGAMLTKRDRERYRSALKDLKDYEIYKEVMETAMVKLQSELELYAKENVELKEHRVYEEKIITKQKNFSEKYSKDLCATKKKLSDVEAQLAESVKQIKQMSRERDTAVATLAQIKSASTQREGQMRMTAELRTGETQEAKKKLADAESLVKSLEKEKEAILKENKLQYEKLHAIQSKQLENIMTLQEENDQLRYALSEIQKSGNYTPDSPIPAAPPVRTTTTKTTAKRAQTISAVSFSNNTSNNNQSNVSIKSTIQAASAAPSSVGFASNSYDTNDDVSGDDNVEVYDEEGQGGDGEMN